MNPFYGNFNKTNSSCPAKLDPGEYEAIVLRIDGLSDDSDTITVVHNIIVGNRIVAYLEKFSKYTGNRRTQALLTDLSKVGITPEDFEAYVGCREHLILGYEYRREQVYLNILSREISPDDSVKPMEANAAV